MTTADALLAVRSTRTSTVERERKRWPVLGQSSQSLEPGRQWVFTDGGAQGWHAAIVVEPGCQVRRVAACRPNTARNVGSELDGVILGLQLATGSAPVTVVSDFLWTAYYINGWRRVSHEYLRERVAVAREVLLERQEAAPVFIHHGGHDKQATEFSQWNDAADRLCRARTAVDDLIDLR